MSEVALQIGGRTYRVACAAGEEERVTRLGATIADKLAAIGNPSGPDAQNLLLAALLLADEVHESREGSGAGDAAPAAQPGDSPLRDRLAAAESELARLESAQRDAADTIAAREAEVAALQSEVAALRAEPAPAAGAATSEDLAPALEKFAEILEGCADRLERRARAS